MTTTRFSKQVARQLDVRGFIVSASRTWAHQDDIAEIDGVRYQRRRMVSLRRHNGRQLWAWAVVFDGAAARRRVVGGFGDPWAAYIHGEVEGWM